jgi:CDP-glucose 4,6-dehydratase
VLITGAYGFVGSALARACLERGDSVCVLRRSQQPRSALVLDGSEARCTVVDGDVLAAGVLDEAIGEQGIDTVFHLAAQAIVAEALRQPSQSFDVNVRGTWLLLEACQRHGVARTVVASTFQAYGEPARLPIDEQLPLHARQPYALTKACADLIARCWWHAYGLPVATARFSNVYGGGDRNLSRLVPGAVAAALRGERPVIRSDGSPQRDFFYVEDAAAAYLAIVDALDGGPVDACGEAFNAGSGSSRSVRDIVQLVCEAVGTGLEPEVRGAAVPEDELERQVTDYTKLQAATGWAPGVALENGIERTVDWYRRHPECL